MWNFPISFISKSKNFDLSLFDNQTWRLFLNTYSVLTPIIPFTLHYSLFYARPNKYITFEYGYGFGARI